MRARSELFAIAAMLLTRRRPSRRSGIRTAPQWVQDRLIENAKLKRDLKGMKRLHRERAVGNEA